jgi:cytochrome P450 / NADPH-cytochrome P450 reductase
VIITASYEGEPADNAGRFVEWMKSMHGEEIKGVKFGLFGCGNTDWVTSYQRIPKLIDRVFEERGAERLIDLGEGNAASDDFFEAFDSWEMRLWETLAEASVSPALLPSTEESERGHRNTTSRLGTIPIY